MNYSCAYCGDDADEPLCVACTNEMRERRRAKMNSEVREAVEESGFNYSGSAPTKPFYQDAFFDSIEGMNAAAESTYSAMASRVHPSVEKWYLDAYTTPLITFQTANQLATRVRDGSRISNPYIEAIAFLGDEHVTEFWASWLCDHIRARQGAKQYTWIHSIRKPHDFKGLYGPHATFLIDTIRDFKK